MSRAEVAVRVRPFGLFRELARLEERRVRLPVGSTVRDLVEHLINQGGFSFLPPQPTVAVNREYASLDRPLEDGDEVALIPPVAGGRGR